MKQTNLPDKSNIAYSLCNQDTKKYEKIPRRKEKSGASTSENAQKKNVCQAIFQKKSSLATHIATVHEGKKAFKCSICDFNCLLKGAMTSHIASVHEKRKLFKCSICDYKCSLKGNLTRYIESVHEDNNNSIVSFVIADVQ